MYVLYMESFIRLGYRINSTMLPADGYFTIAFNFQPAHKPLLCMYVCMYVCM